MHPGSSGTSTTKDWSSSLEVTISSYLIDIGISKEVFDQSSSNQVLRQGQRATSSPTVALELTRGAAAAPGTHLKSNFSRDWPNMGSLVSVPPKPPPSLRCLVRGPR